MLTARGIVIQIQVFLSHAFSTNTLTMASASPLVDVFTPSSQHWNKPFVKPGSTQVWVQPHVAAAAFHRKRRLSCPCHIHFIMCFVRGADPFRSQPKKSLWLSGIIRTCSQKGQNCLKKNMFLGALPWGTIQQASRTSLVYSLLVCRRWNMQEVICM